MDFSQERQVNDMDTKIKVELRLPEDLFLVIEQEAKEYGLSVPRYISMFLKEKYEDVVLLDDEGNPDPDLETGRRKNYKLDPEDVTIIKEEAKKLGVSDIAYLRKLIRTNTFVNLEIVDDDLIDYLARIGELTTAGTSLVNLIRKQGDGQVHTQDIDRMLTILEDVKQLANEQVKLSYSNRKNIYKNMVSKLKKSMR